MNRPATWSAACDAFAVALAEQSLSEDTIAGYVYHLERAAADIGGNPWKTSAGQLAAWIDEQRWSAHTRSKVLVSLRRFYTWAVSEGWLPWSPVAGIRSAEERQKRGPQRNQIASGWAVDIADYLTHLRSGGRRPGTIRARRSILCRLAESAATPGCVTTDQLAEWIAADGLKPETRRSMLGTVRSFYRWAVDAGRVPTDPTVRLLSVRIPRALPKPIPDDQLLAAIAHADDRTRIAILLGALAGLRRAEITQVHLGRDLTEDQLLVRGDAAKGGHERIVPLHPVLASELAAERHRRHQGEPGSGFAGRWPSSPRPAADGWLFPSDAGDGPVSAHHLGGLVADALPPGWTAHSLRHRFATTAYRQTTDLRAVQELLGHASPATTARYAEASPGARRNAVLAVGLDLKPAHRLTSI